MVLTAAIVTSTALAGVGALTGAAAAQSQIGEDDMTVCDDPVGERNDADGDGYMSSFTICVNADTTIREGTLGPRDVPADNGPLVSEGQPKLAYFGIIEQGGEEQSVLLGINQVQPGDADMTVNIEEDISLQTERSDDGFSLEGREITELEVMYVESDSAPSALVLSDFDALDTIPVSSEDIEDIITGDPPRIGDSVPGDIGPLGSGSEDSLAIGSSFEAPWNSDVPLDIETVELDEPVRLEATDDDREEEVTVDANVDGAEILVDGEAVGTTPWTGQFPVDVSDRQGETTITVEAEEYISESQTVELAPPETVEFDLQQLQRPITVLSEEEGNPVSIDGTQVGTTPVTVNRWVGDSYTVTVENVQQADGSTTDQTIEDVTPPQTIQVGASESDSDSDSDSPVVIDPPTVVPGDLQTYPELDYDYQIPTLGYADFEPSPDSTSVGQSVTFDASNSFALGNMSYEWDYGDGAVETVSDPVTNHSYDSAGTYTANLTVNGDQGGTYWNEQTITVENEPPEATLIASTQRPLTGESVTLDAGPSSDPEDSLVSYEWDFDGDGQAETTGQSVSHAFPDPGDYTVELTVADDAGNTDETSRQLTVNRPNSPPQADFDVQTDGQTVTFEADATDPDGSIERYSWELGDGTQANGETVTHEYDSDASYSARLLVTDDRGDLDTASETVEISTSDDPTPTEEPADDDQPADDSTPTDESSGEEDMTTDTQSSDREQQESGETDVMGPGLGIVAGLVALAAMLLVAVWKSE